MRASEVLGGLSFAGFVVSLVLGLVAALGTRFGLFSFATGLGVLLPWTVYIAFAALALGLAWAVLRWMGQAKEGRYGLIGVIGAAVVLALPLYNYAELQNSPPIHDISTDIANPPEFRALLPLRKGAANAPDYNGNAQVRWRGKTRSAAEWQRRYYADIFTLRLLMPPAKMYQRALRAARAMGWTIVAQSPDEGRIEATDTSFFFGLTDDIVIRVRPSGIGAKIDIRSESRMSRNDAGRNAEAIRDFLKLVKRG